MRTTPGKFPQARLLRALALLSLLLVSAAGAQPLQPAPDVPPYPIGPVDQIPEEIESTVEIVSGPEVPSYFVVTAFLRRAKVVLERRLEERPDFFATYGCTPGDPRFERCSELIHQAAEIYTRETDQDDPVANQAGLDAKGREIGEIYAELLNLLSKKPGDAAGFHAKVEEVRITVGIGLSDKPGYDLLESARIFDQVLKADFPAAASLPGYVPAPPKKPTKK